MHLGQNQHQYLTKDFSDNKTTMELHEQSFQQKKSRDFHQTL